MLRLAGPMQSWGVHSKFNSRPTQTEPSKSGVIGLIASALGRSREESVEDLTNLRFGVRVDQEGLIETDLQIATVYNDKTASTNGKARESIVDPFLSYYEYNKLYKEKYKEKKPSASPIKTTLTTNYFIADGIFVVGLESDDKDFLITIEKALKNPKYPLYLGRRSYIPTMPLFLGIRNLPLEEALESEIWQMNPEDQNWEKNQMRIICEIKSNEDTNVFQNDFPISFDSRNRKFIPRGMKEIFKPKGDYNTKHDFFSTIPETKEENSQAED